MKPIGAMIVLSYFTFICYALVSSKWLNDHDIFLQVVKNIWQVEKVPLEAVVTWAWTGMIPHLAEDVLIHACPILPAPARIWRQYCLFIHPHIILSEAVLFPGRIVHILLPGCCNRFSCTQIKWCSQLAKVTIPLIHPLYPIPSPTTGCTNWPIYKIHISKLNWR